jgi:hypothetical protein
MKKLSLLVALSLMAFTGFAQEAVIANAKLNVLFVGVDNPIDIAVPNVSAEKIKVSLDKDKKAGIRKVADGKYIVNIVSIGTGELNLTVEAEGLTTTKKFRVKYVPDPVAVIEGIKGGYLSANSLKEAKGLQAILPNFDYDATCTIQSYKVHITPKNGVPVQYVVKGSTFPQNVAAHFQNIESGTTVLFSDIKARCEKDTISRDIGQLQFVVQ